jgi:hypothetical protein
MLALRQFGNDAVLLVLAIAGTLSIAFFNFFGVSVTKFASAAQR